MNNNIKFDLLVPALGNKTTKSVKVEEYLGFLPYSKMIISNAKGLGKARNELACSAESDYLLFVDLGVKFSKKIFDLYIKPAIMQQDVVAYEGNNGILCTRVFGIPKKLFFKVGGFDESFHIGEDLEMGYRLKKLGVNVQIIPKDSLYDSIAGGGSKFWGGLKARIRVGLRYGVKSLYFPPVRKKDWLAFPYMLLGFFYYKINNGRASCEK